MKYNSFIKCIIWKPWTNVHTEYKNVERYHIYTYGSRFLDTMYICTFLSCGNRQQNKMALPHDNILNGSYWMTTVIHVWRPQFLSPNDCTFFRCGQCVTRYRNVVIFFRSFYWNNGGGVATRYIKGTIYELTGLQKYIRVIFVSDISYRISGFFIASRNIKLPFRRRFSQTSCSLNVFQRAANMRLYEDTWCIKQIYSMLCLMNIWIE